MVILGNVSPKLSIKLDVINMDRMATPAKFQVMDIMLMVVSVDHATRLRLHVLSVQSQQPRNV